MHGPTYPHGNPSEFRVEKARTEATLTLSNGTTVRGCFFVAGGSRTHAGPEGVKDLLNGDSLFLPFEIRGPEGPSTLLCNRGHIVFVELPDRGEVRRHAGYDVAIERQVTVLLSNGVTLEGGVRIWRPQGRDRLSDFARAGDPFWYLEAENATYLINVHHIIKIAEEPSAS